MSATSCASWSSSNALLVLPAGGNRSNLGGHRVRAVAVVLFLLASPLNAFAQSSPARFEAGAHLASAASGEFNATDVGVGGRLAWFPWRAFGVEAEFTSYPRRFPDPPAFSRSRFEGLFGLTLGPAFEHARAYARVRPGFVTFHEAPGPIVCILIYPPPLQCVLAAGQTLFALDLGGGVEIFPTRRTYVRVDAGDRLLRYTGPVLSSDRRARAGSFFGHDFRFAAGGGVRF
ncbi:MAG TPA: hypothetical protein VEK56_01360 [Vicinamibacterales bacterium]|nr:hypothetical protein [Vicinamibacterales bacterium]